MHLLPVLLLLTPTAHPWCPAQVGTVNGQKKILFPSRDLDPGRYFLGADFGSAVAFPGDLDGDGNIDLAVGAPEDDGGGFDQGAIWIFFLSADGRATGEVKIAQGLGGFGGALADGDCFGGSSAALGDLDSDGVGDLAVGAWRDGDGGTLYNGSLWILFLNADGTVRDEQKISETAGGFGGALDGDNFGSSVATVGDLDDDGLPELAVGARKYSNGLSSFEGSVWILFLNADGTVRDERRIREGESGFLGPLDSADGFGSAVAGLGDLDDDGHPEIAVGSWGDDDGSMDRGAAWILSLASDGSVLSEQKISSTMGGFTGTLASNDHFGCALAGLGDLDADGIEDLAVGAFKSDVSGNDLGAVWILFLNSDGTVGGHRKIANGLAGFGGGIDPLDDLGLGLAATDLDADGEADLAVGATGDDDGGSDNGAAWLVHLNPDGSVSERQKLGDPLDRFGSALAPLGDLDGDGHRDLAVGSVGVDGGADRGEVWVLFLAADGSVSARQEIGDGQGGFGGVLDDYDRFGSALANAGDLDGDGVVDLIVGAEGDDDGGLDQGAVWVLYLNADGTVKSESKISELSGGFPGAIDASDAFGAAVASLVDLDGDGVVDLAVGAPGDDDGGSAQGAVWILFLNADGTVKDAQKISETVGGFGGVLDPDRLFNPGDAFGAVLAGLGDFDGDGVPDLAVGTPNDDDGAPNQGAVWILFLDSDGTVKEERKLSELEGGLGNVLVANDAFGSAVCAVGDLDADGVLELAVGEAQDDTPFANTGGLWILFFAPDGSVRAKQKISTSLGGFGGTLAGGDAFGSAVALVGDLDGDGVGELAVGAEQDSLVDEKHGSAWILFLRGSVRLDFEVEDDFETQLVNGQDLSSPEEFGRLVSISSAGANAGAAVFDSTPGGPNDPGPDGDLLVGSGLMVILQSDGSASQSVPGVFDLPDDDDDGGELCFDFAAAVRLQRLDLVDIDESVVVPTTVTLVDTLGRERLYVVEPGWTDGPGRRTLDLTQLVPQLGRGGIVTVSEQAGFAPYQVVRLELEFAGSGALDNLVWWPASSAPALPEPHFKRSP